MESQLNIFNMVDEMGSILLTLQSNMIKVMDGINQLNFIISKIKQYKVNNNMMNNMMNNIQNINMGMNNMMNIQNMQMQMNDMMNNNINNNMNIFNQNLIDEPDGWYLIFDDREKNDKVFIRISEQKLVKEAINKYLMKTGKNSKYKYIYNTYELNPEIKICESGLKNMAQISVITYGNIPG